MTVTWIDVVGSLVLFTCCSLSASAGVGGGILNVGVFLMLWSFDYTDAVVLSLSALLGNYFSQLFFVNIWLRHPKEPSRPLIYYEIIMILFPLQLGGANIGVVLGTIFPETLLLMFAVAVLLYAIYVAIDRASVLYDIENSKLQLTHGVLPSQARGEQQALLGDRGRASEQNYDLTKHHDSSIDEEIAAVNQEEEDFDDIKIPIVIPWKYVAVSIIIWMLYALSYLGLVTSSSCSTEYYVMLVIVYPFIAIHVVVSYKILVEQQKATVEEDSANARMMDNSTNDSLAANQLVVDDSQATARVTRSESETSIEKHSSLAVDSALVSGLSAKRYAASVLEGDIIWEELSFVPFVLCALIGCLAVMLGVGGGELYSPLFLSMNIKPDVIAATIPCMLILNTSSSLLRYMTLGDVEYEYAAWMFCIGLLGGYVGRSFSLWITKVLQRTSIIVYTFIIVLLCSLGLYIYYLYVDMDNASFTFSSFCGW